MAEGSHLLKRKEMRFFANAQNDTIVSFFVIQQRSEGSHVLMCFERKETITRDSSPAAE
jgi:hypothetical protein